MPFRRLIRRPVDIHRVEITMQEVGMRVVRRHEGRLGPVFPADAIHRVARDVEDLDGSPHLLGLSVAASAIEDPAEPRLGFRAAPLVTSRSGHVMIVPRTTARRHRRERVSGCGFAARRLARSRERSHDSFAEICNRGSLIEAAVGEGDASAHKPDERGVSARRRRARRREGGLGSVR